MPCISHLNKKVKNKSQKVLTKYNLDCIILTQFDAGWSSLVARRAHNPKVVGSNPASATKWSRGVAVITSACHAEDREFDSRRDRHLYLAL